ncbi:MAG: hypothetical protein JWP74_290 [Marmoricola sp.]|nr:hypothetical protein [Marmoricola sp.]
MRYGGRQGSIQRPTATLVPVVATSLFFGVPVYFVAFLFAYGFQDSVGWKNHLSFLAAIAIFAVLCGLSVLLAAVWEPAVTTGELFAFGIQAALALNALVVGIASLVSDANTDQGSVTAGYPQVTDALIAGALFGVSIFFGRKAYRLTAVR